MLHQYTPKDQSSTCTRILITAYDFQHVCCTAIKWKISAAFGMSSPWSWSVERIRKIWLEQLDTPIVWWTCLARYPKCFMLPPQQRSICKTFSLTYNIHWSFFLSFTPGESQKAKLSVLLLAGARCWRCETFNGPGMQSDYSFSYQFPQYGQACPSTRLAYCGFYT